MLSTLADMGAEGEVSAEFAGGLVDDADVEVVDSVVTDPVVVSCAVVAGIVFGIPLVGNRGRDLRDRSMEAAMAVDVDHDVTRDALVA